MNGWGRSGLARGRAGVADTTASATREGPSRLTSTAASSGESKLTVAAEWTTMSHAREGRRPSSSRPRPSVATSPATAVTRRPPPASNSLARARARSRSKQSFLRISLVARCSAVDRRPGRMSSTTSQSGTQRRSRSTRAVPRNPVAPVMKNSPAGQGVADAGHRICLPYGK